MILELGKAMEMTSSKLPFNKEVMILKDYISCSRSQSKFIAKHGLDPRSADSEASVLY